MLTAKQLNDTVPYALSEELEYVSALARSLPEESPVVVMIGAGPGVFGIAVVEGSPSAQLTVVDIDPNILPYCKKHLEAAGISDVLFVEGDSYEAGELYLGQPIDLLIIDGDHSSRGVQRDIEAWSKQVKRGGFIFFHDYMEREGGFNGSGEWQFSEGSAPMLNLLDYKEHWELEAAVGISLVVRKKHLIEL